MSSGASGWTSSQPRRCAGRQAGAHRRGEEEPPEETDPRKSKPPSETAFTLSLRGISFWAFSSRASLLQDREFFVVGR
jgi:hypothetical protein